MKKLMSSRWPISIAFVIIILVSLFMEPRNEDKRIINSYFRSWGINLKVEESSIIKIDDRRWFGEYADFVIFGRDQELDDLNHNFIQKSYSILSGKGHSVPNIFNESTLASLLKDREIEYWRFAKGKKDLAIIVLDDLVVYYFSNF